MERTLELRLPQRRGVAGDDDELGLASTESLEGRLVTQSDLAGLRSSSVPHLFLPNSKCPIAP